jgi:hypothetical protein
VLRHTHYTRKAFPQKSGHPFSLNIFLAFFMNSQLVRLKGVNHGIAAQSVPQGCGRKGCITASVVPTGNFSVGKRVYPYVDFDDCTSTAAPIYTSKTALPAR